MASARLPGPFGNLRLCYNSTALRGTSTGGPPTDLRLATRHFRFGWLSVAVFGTLGLLLESLHGFKVGAYLDASNETRRLMWTLAHAHGTLLGLVHVAFAATLRLADPAPRRLATASRSLVWASLLLPGGFFLGGIRFYAGDPGVGVVLVPIGAVLLIAAATLVVLALGTTKRKS